MPHHQLGRTVSHHKSLFDLPWLDVYRTACPLPPLSSGFEQPEPAHSVLSPLPSSSHLSQAIPTSRATRTGFCGLALINKSDFTTTRLAFAEACRPRMVPTLNFTPSAWPCASHATHLFVEAIAAAFGACRLVISHTHSSYYAPAACNTPYQ